MNATLLRPAVATRALTLRTLQEVLVEVERAEGLIVARKLVAALDYVRLTELARAGLEGVPDDDPRQVDPRFVLLLGMEGPAVRALQEALRSLRRPAPVTGVFDEVTLHHYLDWLSSVGRR